MRSEIEKYLIFDNFTVTVVDEITLIKCVGMKSSRKELKYETFLLQPIVFEIFWTIFRKDQLTLVFAFDSQTKSTIVLLLDI